MTAITVPFYNIWIRTLDTKPLYSRWDPTQARSGRFNPSIIPPTAPDQTSGLRSQLCRGFIRVGLVTNYEKLEFKTKYNNVGGWTLLMQDGTEEAGLLRNICQGQNNANYINQGGYGGITVVRDGKTIFSGSVRGFEATGDFYAESGPMIEFWGVDDTAFLESRITMTPAPGNDLVPKSTTSNDPYTGFFYSGRQISTNNAVWNYTATYIAPIDQGWGYYKYPNVGGYSNVFRSVTAGLRQLVQLNIGVYSPYPYTYPFTYVVPTGRFYADVVANPSRRQAVLYNAEPQVSPVTLPQSASHTPRRIPFLFCGKTNNPRNAYINNEDSTEAGENVATVPSFIMRARYENLLEKCQEISSFTTEPLDYNNLPAYRGYQFSVNQDDIEVVETLPDGTDVITKIDGLRFNYQQPAQKEDTIIFSQSFGNLGSYKYSFNQPTSNYVIAAGQGEAALRWFMRQRSSNIKFGLPAEQFKFGLREKFIDRRDVQYGQLGSGGAPNTPGFQANTLPVSPIAPFVPTPPRAPLPTDIQLENYDDMTRELQDAIDVVLREDGTVISLELGLLNVPSTQYFVDYFVGNWVTVRIGNQDIVGQITDVVVSLTRDGGEVITATVGTQAVGDNFAIFDGISQNRQNVTRLEISQ